MYKGTRVEHVPTRAICAMFKWY